MPGTEDRNQKIECHTTFYLARKLQLSRQMEVAIILWARITFLGEGTLNECMRRGYLPPFEAFTS